MKQFLLFAISLLFISCEITKAPVTYYKTDTSTIIKENSKEVGEAIFQEEEGYFSDAIKVTKSSNIKGTSKPVEIQVNDIFIHKETVNKSRYFYSEPNDKGTLYAIVITAKNKQRFLRYEMSGWTGYDFEEPIEYIETKAPNKDKNYFNREFLYTGKNGNVVKFTYREFSNSLARPAFYQDVEYDLNESNIIGFRGMRIEILEATNTKINYKILNGFSK